MIIDEFSYKYINNDHNDLNDRIINTQNNFNQVLKNNNKRKLYSTNTCDDTINDTYDSECSEYYNELKNYKIISNSKNKINNKKKQILNFQKITINEKTNSLNLFKDGYGNIINYYKLNSNKKSVPKLIINQLNYNKININNIFNNNNLNNTNNNKPIILIFFGPGDDYFINKINSVQNKLINEMKDVKFIGISASIGDNSTTTTNNNNNNSNNNYPFKVIHDSGSKIIKSLNLLDPLGGGIYPISSILIFDSNGLETVKLNYKYNHDFLNHSSNEFENLIYDVLDYLS
ncbi:hypothetical protein B5S31_g4696 [[Candida] boidinii]|nr:hypothetical protein B5S29_g5523 [[Candida] boidinii]OWB74865.1 hypothetical protein B5S31_g4696 [[Candida] boidinii]GME68424.1 unnamed protein product [[Candida] boidinii]